AFLKSGVTVNTDGIAGAVAVVNGCGKEGAPGDEGDSDALKDRPEPSLERALNHRLVGGASQNIPHDVRTTVLLPSFQAKPRRGETSPAGLWKSREKGKGAVAFESGDRNRS